MDGKLPRTYTFNNEHIMVYGSLRRKKQPNDISKVLKYKI